MEYRYKIKKGFSLLEVLLSGVIIIIVLSSLIVIGRNTIDNSSSLQRRLQATYLAQEGIELTRQIRDTNYLDSNNKTSWSDLVYNKTNQNFEKPNFNNTTSYGLSLESSLERYILNNSVETIALDGTDFTRKITFKESSGSFALSPIEYNGDTLSDSDIKKQAVKVIAEVSWDDKKAKKKIVIEELITNSRQAF